MQDPMTPKWAQPVHGEHHCSICENPNVYYSDVHLIEMPVMISLGEIIRPLSVVSRCYCKDCFEDCGGKDFQIKNCL